MKKTAVLSALAQGLAGWLPPSVASASDRAQIQVAWAGAQEVNATASREGKPNAIPPILSPLSPPELAELRRAEAQKQQNFSYHLPASARYSNAETNLFATKATAHPDPWVRTNKGVLTMFDNLAVQRPTVINTLSTRTRRWAISLAAAPLLLGALGSGRPALSPDSGLAGCTAVAGTHQVAAADYPAIGAQFAGSRWPDLRFSGTAYVEIATKLLTTHAYGGETAWFYQRLSAACAKHGRALPF